MTNKEKLIDFIKNLTDEEARKILEHFGGCGQCNKKTTTNHR